MPDSNQIKTQIVVEDQFSRSFTSLNGSLMDATYSSRKFEKGFTSSMNNSSMAAQNFSSQFNNSFVQVNGTLQQTNASMYGMNNNPAFGQQSRLLTGVMRFRAGIAETKLLVDDVNEAFIVLGDKMNRDDGKKMSFFGKIALARKILKLFGVDGIKQMVKFVLALDTFKSKFGAMMISVSNSLSMLSQNSAELLSTVRPLVKVASHFVPFLNMLLPYLDQLPDQLGSAAESTNRLGEQIEGATIPGVKFLRLGEKLLAVWNNPAYRKLLAVTGLAMLGGAFMFVMARSETMQNAVRNAFDTIKEKLEEFDIELMLASTNYMKFRTTMMKFGNLDGAYFGLKNLISDGVSGLKDKFLKSDIGISAQARISELKKKLDEIDTELMWHSRTYAKFRNKMMEKGFWGAVGYYIKRADSYLINHSETYVKFRKIVNKNLNNAIKYYEKNWKNLFTSSKIYIASFKRDIQDAFLVKDIADDGAVKHSFLPSYFFKNLTDLETYKDLWGKCREYLNAFYKDLKDTPLGGPLQKLEDALTWIEEKFGDVKDKFSEWIGDAKSMFGDWKLTAQIYFASVTDYIKKNYKDWILTAKIYFASFKSKVIKLAKDLWLVYGVAKKVANYVKFMKFSWDTLSLAKEKITELIQETEYLQKRKAVFVQFGQAAGEEFTRFSERASIELGKTKDEILDAGLAFKKFGFSNKSIEDVINLSDRLEDLNPGQSFQGIRDAFLEAFKSGSSEGLAELIGGGRGSQVERAMKKMRLDRYLRKGDVQGFLTEFKKVADQFGYTQERADEMDTTIHAKLGQVSAHFDRLSEGLKTTFFDAIEPYVTKLLDFLNSSEFQAWFTRMKRQLAAILKIVGWFVEKIVDVGSAIVRWWIEPSGEFLRRILLVVTMFMFFRKVIAVVRVVTVAMSALGVVLTLLKHPIKAIIRAFTKAREESKKFFKGVKDDAGKLTAIASATATGAVVAGSFFYQSMTGENHGMLENFVRFFVPGIITGWYNILNAGIFVWNKIRDVVRAVMQGVIATVFDGVRIIITAMFPLLEVINQIDKFFDDREKNHSVLKTAEAMLDNAHSVVGDEAFYGAGGGQAMMTILEKQKDNIKNGDTQNKGFMDKLFTVPVLERFNEIKPYTEDEILEKANSGLEWALDAKNTVLDALGLNTLESYQDEWDKLQGDLQDTNDHLSHIRKNTKEMDLLWMKQLAEQRFVNNVNVRQLTPNINVKVSGSRSSAQDTANAIAMELNQMADAGTFNAYGSPA